MNLESHIALSKPREYEDSIYLKIIEAIPEDMTDLRDVMKIVDETLEELKRLHNFWSGPFYYHSLDNLRTITEIKNNLQTEWFKLFGKTKSRDIREESIEPGILTRISKQYGDVPTNEESLPSFSCMHPTYEGGVCNVAAYIYTRIGDSTVSLTCSHHRYCLPEIYGDRQEGPWITI